MAMAVAEPRFQRRRAATRGASTTPRQSARHARRLRHRTAGSTWCRAMRAWCTRASGWNGAARRRLPCMDLPLQSHQHQLLHRFRRRQRARPGSNPASARGTAPCVEPVTWNGCRRACGPTRAHLWLRPPGAQSIDPWHANPGLLHRRRPKRYQRSCAAALPLPQPPNVPFLQLATSSASTGHDQASSVPPGHTDLHGCHRRCRRRHRQLS